MKKVLMSICIIGAVGCFIYAVNWFTDGWRHKNNSRQLAESFHNKQPLPEASEDTASVNAEGRTDPSGDRFAYLSLLNPDVVGWLVIEGTSIDYPVVQGDDNEYYLNVDFHGQTSDRGAIFRDYRYTDDDSYNIIYGHHMKDGTMFHDLYLYKSPDYRDKHPNILFIPAEGGEEAFMVVEVLYWHLSNENEQDFLEYFFGLDNSNGKLLALITCDNAAFDSRLIVVARQMEAG